MDDRESQRTPRPRQPSDKAPSRGASAPAASDPLTKDRVADAAPKREAPAQGARASADPSRPAREKAHAAGAHPRSGGPTESRESSHDERAPIERPGFLARLWSKLIGHSGRTQVPEPAARPAPDYQAPRRQRGPGPKQEPADETPRGEEPSARAPEPVVPRAAAAKAAAAPERAEAGEAAGPAAKADAPKAPEARAQAPAPEAASAAEPPPPASAPPREPEVPGAPEERTVPPAEAEKKLAEEPSAPEPPAAEAPPEPGRVEEKPPEEAKLPAPEAETPVEEAPTPAEPLQLLRGQVAELETRATQADEKRERLAEALASAQTKAEQIESRTATLATDIKAVHQQLEAHESQLTDMRSQVETLRDISQKLVRQVEAPPSEEAEFVAMALQKLSRGISEMMGGVKNIRKGAERVLPNHSDEEPATRSGTDGNTDGPPVPAAESVPEPAAPALDRAGLVEGALRKEQEDLKADQQELDAALAALQRHQEQGSVLRGCLDAAAEPCDTALAKCRAQAQERLPAELRGRFEGLQKGMDLVGKMFSRLLERAPDTDVPEELSLPQVGREGWDRLLADHTDHSAALKEVRAKLRQIGQDRYRVVTQARQTAESARKGIRSFLGKQLLLVLDGVDGGEGHAHSLAEEVRADAPAAADWLTAWASAYGELRQELLKVLDSMGVQPMRVQPRDVFDPMRHEPSSVESDPEMDNETIKEVTRKGYEYVGGEDEEASVLRSAQVVVVKK